MRTLILLTLGVDCLLAQTPKSFEVVSIKPTEMINRGFAKRVDGPIVTYQGFSVQLLVSADLGMPDYRIVWPKDVGDWVKDLRFDIVAKAPGDAKPTPGEVQEMVRSLLAERFGMKSHAGTIEIPVYNLVVAEGGPKLKPAAADAPSRMQRGSEGWVFTGASMSSLAIQGLLGVDRPVFDKTGLTGKYDFVLNVPLLGGAGPGPNDPSIFTVLREDFGLRLEPARQVVETFVIDQVTRPTPN